MIELGNNIKTARKKRGLTQEELAIQLNVTPQAVSRWESGTGMPDISMLVPLSQVLSVSIDALFGIEKAGQDEMQYMEIRRAFEEIESQKQSPAEAALSECRLLSEKCEANPASYVYACCFVETAANLTRYLDDMQESDQNLWKDCKEKAIRQGIWVIRFCDIKEWVERTHFALAWIYIHEKDFMSARDHIQMLPSVASNRLQESILAQAASMESGVAEMKKVLRQNLQNFTRALNKEMLYAATDLSWSDEPETAVDFSVWALEVMQALCKNKDLIPYCRGFLRDIYRALLHADLRMEDYEGAAKHFTELKKGMQMHFDFYQHVFESEEESGKYPARQLRNMRAYTQEFIREKQEGILQQLKEWHGQEKYQKLTDKI